METSGTKYLYKRDGKYCYIRTIPERYRHRFRNKRQIWRSLNTDHYPTAVQKLAEHLFEYDAISKGETEYSVDRQITRIDTTIHGERLRLNNMTSTEIMGAAIEDAVLAYNQRLSLVRNMSSPTSLDVATIAGATEVAALTMPQAFKRYLEITPEFADSKNSIKAGVKTRRYERSIEDFVARMGDLDILKLEVATAKSYRDELKHAVVTDSSFKSHYANDHLGNLKRVLEAVFDKDYPGKINPFAGLRIRIDDDAKRSGFTEKEVEQIFAALPKSKMSDQSKAVVMLGAITGAGQTELCWLMKDDIVLDSKYPHIRIDENAMRQKVKGGGARHRLLPIVDPDVVEFLRKFPDGFTEYHDHKGPRRLTAKLHKFFSKTTPGKGHNGFRHRLDDLLKMSGTDIGLKASISGHALPGKVLYYGKSGGAYKLSQKKLAIETALNHAKTMDDDI